jgi:Flp pilus assembly protein TadG
MRGQSTVEFAIVATIFFTMLFGIIEGGRMLFTYHQVTNASREGARYAVAHGIASDTQVSGGDYGAMISHVTERTVGLTSGGLTIDAQWPGDPNATDLSEDNPRCPLGANNAGCPVRVTANYTYEPIVAMFAGVGSFQMSSSSEMRIHY